MMLLFLLLASCSGELTRIPAPDTEPEPDTELTTWQQHMLQAVNDIRAEGCRCGSQYMPATTPLSWDDQLRQAAQVHVQDMERHDFFDHEGSDNSSVGDRAGRVGYSWRGIAENIAKGHTSVEQVVQGWKNSPGHCRNMMNPNYIHLGAARQNNTWVQVLGTNR